VMVSKPRSGFARSKSHRGTEASLEWSSMCVVDGAARASRMDRIVAQAGAAIAFADRSLSDGRTTTRKGYHLRQSEVVARG
jgi:hypothetical protein